VLLWGKNLADSAYYTSANLSNDYWFRTPGPGMTWGVQLDLEF
jgi:outer membrane receptor protein involved in Fe transport